MFLVFVLMGCTLDQEHELVVADSFYLGGIQINEPDHQDWAQSLKNVGMNTVSVTVYARQGIWNKDNLWWRENEDGLISEIDAAKDAGLEVVFIPRLLLDHYFEENKFLWHGMVMPKEDDQVKQWFKNYTQFIMKWAAVCEEKNVAMMAIGSELRALSRCSPITTMPPLEEYYLNPYKQNQYLQNHLAFEDDISVEELWVRGANNFQNLESYLKAEIDAYEDWAKQTSFQDEPDALRRINERRALLRQEWKKLIGQIRTVYTGQLTYASNFDNYHNIAFWEDLDVMGINAYFKLRKLEEETELRERLHYSWDTTFVGIDRLQKKLKIKKPVLFTELGYINRKNCTVMPWEGSGFSVVEQPFENHLLIWSEQEEEENERSMAIQSLYEVTRSSQVPLIGLLYWKLTTKDYHLPYEPFALHIDDNKTQGLQESLLQFVK